MNEDRRKRLAALVEQLQEIHDEEELAFENLPESLQGGERGREMEEAASEMDSAVDILRPIAEG